MPSPSSSEELAVARDALAAALSRLEVRGAEVCKHIEATILLPTALGNPASGEPSQTANGYHDISNEVSSHLHDQNGVLVEGCTNVPGSEAPGGGSPITPPTRSGSWLVRRWWGG